MNQTTTDLFDFPPSSFPARVKTAFFSNAFAAASLLTLISILFMAIAVPLLSSYSYEQINLSKTNLPPSASHWFGTDDLGRDMFVRVWFGARISLFVGCAAALIDLIVGVLWGGISALAGGKTDEAMMRLADILNSIPSLLVVISLIVVIGPGLHTIVIALSLFGWITMARVVRSQILQIKQEGYVLAAKTLGASFWRILFKHLVPNAIGPITVTLTLTVPSAIFTEAFLSYLGLGVQAPIASWGTMASEGLPAFEFYPWRLFFPAVFISATMLAFNAVGDALNDAISVATNRHS